MSGGVFNHCSVARDCDCVVAADCVAALQWKTNQREFNNECRLSGAYWLLHCYMRSMVHHTDHREHRIASLLLLHRSLVMLQEYIGDLLIFEGFVAFSQAGGEERSCVE